MARSGSGLDAPSDFQLVGATDALQGFGILVPGPSTTTNTPRNNGISWQAQDYSRNIYSERATAIYNALLRLVDITKENLQANNRGFKAQ